MKKNVSTYSALLAAQPEDAAKIDAWLEERLGEELPLEDIDPVKEESSHGEQLSSVSTVYDGCISQGQIRILSKRYTNDPMEIPYVAVIEKWEPDDSWLVIPYSKYKTPATPGEMSTGSDLFGQGALQIWNARTVQTRLLEKSFLFGMLDERTRRNAADLFRHELSGKALPATFDSMTGPSVVYEADPRRDYIVECIDRLRPLSTAVKATACLIAAAERENSVQQDGEQGGVLEIDWGDVVADGRVARPIWGEPEYEQALSAGNAADVTDTFIIEKDELSVEYSPEDRKARMTVYDQNDCPNAVYDGYGVIGKNGEFLGVLRNGAITVPADSVKGGFQLVDPEGEAISLSKKERI